VRNQLETVFVRKISAENRRDILSVFIVVPWQVVLFLTPMTMIAGRWDNFFVLLIILSILSLGLYLTWYRHLKHKVESD